MMKDVERQVSELYETDTAKQYFSFDAQSEMTPTGMDASIASMAERLLAQLDKKYSKLFGKASWMLAEKMVEQAGKESAVNLARSAEKLSGQLTLKTQIFNSDLKETYKASINANADLIVSIQSQYIDKVKSAVYRSISTGNGVADLKPFFEKEFGMTERKAKNIALDQTRKAYNSINADRMRAVGMNKFEWVHSGGGHKPRELHITEYPAGLNGGIFDVNDPPVIDEKTGERGLPGTSINCRCVMRPLLEFGDDE